MAKKTDLRMYFKNDINEKKHQSLYKETYESTIQSYCTVF